ncbi:hypothetical protein AM506_21895, partial [Rossellomorea vietnamensis]
LAGLGLAEAMDELQQMQGVGVHGVDMEEVVLHQPHGAAELRQVLAQHPVAVHAPQLACHVAAGAQQLHEQALVAYVIAVEVVDQVAMVADLADGVGPNPLDPRVLGHQQEQLEQRRGAVAEDGARARLDIAILDLEALVERLHRQGFAGVEDRLVEVLQQHVVEAGQRRHVAVVALHE